MLSNEENMRRFEEYVRAWYVTRASATLPNEYGGVSDEEQANILASHARICAEALHKMTGFVMPGTFTFVYDVNGVLRFRTSVVARLAIAFDVLEGDAYRLVHSLEGL